ncbi:putative sulfate exporter family transporter [Marivibrio halodurans]|uniref:Putative sulfate exporter family transporter n=1 Tax=Marivibrio halodurans TaxID=2039722 RepID=A0A8J7V2W6_9PROT|nr:putative sulfate exporter family transporter [Marivibrio halodurans]MBP5856189.1 putative sulfate exporter family transporter [Marivibrio halodurans]
MMVGSTLSRSFGAGYRLVPGLLTVTLVALSATFLARQYVVPVMLMALLLGASVHFLSKNEECRAGIDFAARRVLRFGVALLGARLSIEQLSAIGYAPIVAVAIAVPVTILLGALVARFLKLRPEIGVLTGGATAICGASAAMAISAVLPNHRDRDRDTAFAVLGVTTLSTIAMVAYPALARALGYDDVEAAVLIGATIHDVAQVAGAGFTISEEAGELAIFVKLVRVLLLLPTVLLIALWARGRADEDGAGAADRRDTHGVARPPLFLVAFVALFLLNSAGLIPALLADALATAAGGCLVFAVAALGLKTNLKSLLRIGPAACFLLAGETLFLLALFVAARAFGVL